MPGLEKCVLFSLIFQQDTVHQNFQSLLGYFLRCSKRGFSLRKDGYWKQEDLYHSCIFKIQKQQHIFWDQPLQAQKQQISLFSSLPSHLFPCDYTSPHQNQTSQQQKAAFSCTSHRVIIITFSSSLHAETAVLHWQCTGGGMGTQTARALPRGPPQKAWNNKRCISDTGCLQGLSQPDAG